MPNKENKSKKYPMSLLAIVIFLGILLGWMYKNTFTVLLFNGKTYYGRNTLYQVAFPILCAAGFSAILFVISLFLKDKKWLTRGLDRLSQRYTSFRESIKSNVNYRIYVSLAIIGIGAVCVFLINDIFTLINTDEWVLRPIDLMPTYTPVGGDFREGLYKPAYNLFVGKSFMDVWNNTVKIENYPPLVNLLSAFYLFFSENEAYFWQVGLIVAANLLSLGICASILKRYILSGLGLSDHLVSLISLVLFVVMAFFTFSGYPFIFSMERGNYDIFAILFALLALWVLLRKPEKMWLQIVLLSIATHLKIYPAILFVLLFRKHKWKAVLPSILTNVGLLFILGPNNAVAFLKTILQSGGADNFWHWIGNHSSYSFVKVMLINVFPGLQSAFTPLWIVFTLLPIILWGIAAYKLFSKDITPQDSILFFMISVPVMDVLPTIGHDYKLVILYPAILLLIGLIIKCLIRTPKRVEFVQLALVVVILLFIGRSYVFFNPETVIYYLFGNKYIWSMLLEGLILWNLLRIQKQQRLIDGASV